MKKIVSIIAVLAFATAAQAAVTTTVTSAPTVGLAGYTTYTVNFTTDVGVLTAVEADITGPLNQRNPFGMPSIWMDSNGAMAAAGFDVSQDSQMLFLSSDGPVGLALESPTALHGAMAFLAGSPYLVPSLDVVQVCVADGDSVVLGGFTSVLVDGDAVEIPEMTIPEPASLALLGMGGFGVLLRRKR